MAKDAGDTKRLTLGEAITDLGFLPWLFGLLVGTPSVISLWQTLFIDHTLTALPQWFIDQYNAALAWFGGLVEPHLSPLVAWFGALFGWELTLYPHWRPIFVLLMVSALSNARISWREGNRGLAVRLFPSFVLIYLLFSLAVGAHEPIGDEARQAILAVGAVVVFFGSFRFFVGMFIGNRFDTRGGLTMLGGFLGAGLVYLLDWAFKAWL